jgi:5-methylcytosine-specific restriction endonuclease McrA
MPWDKTREDRRQDSQRYGAAWRKAREACLRAANWRCQIQLSGCAGAASQADHIDQAENDPNHQRLRAACKPCHAKITAQQGMGYRAPKDPEPRPRTAW